MGNTQSKKSKQNSLVKNKEPEQPSRTEIGVQCALLIPTNKQDLVLQKVRHSSKRIQVDIKPWLETRSNSPTPLIGISSPNYHIPLNEGFYQASKSNTNYKDFLQTYEKKKPDVIPETRVFATNYQKNFDLTRVRQAPSKWIHPAPHMGDFSAMETGNFIWQAPSGPVCNIKKSSKDIFLRKANSWHQYANQNNKNNY